MISAKAWVESDFSNTLRCWTHLRKTSRFGSISQPWTSRRERHSRILFAKFLPCLRPACRHRPTINFPPQGGEKHSYVRTSTCTILSIISGQVDLESCLVCDIFGPSLYLRTISLSDFRPFLKHSLCVARGSDHSPAWSFEPPRSKHPRNRDGSTQSPTVSWIYGLSAK